MSTVTGIIDGFGSVGAALEGVLVGGISGLLGWNSVFYFLMLFSLLCCLTITRVVKHELFGVGGTASYGAKPDEQDALKLQQQRLGGAADSEDWKERELDEDAAVKGRRAAVSDARVEHAEDPDGYSSAGHSEH